MPPFTCTEAATTVSGTVFAGLLTAKAFVMASSMASLQTEPNRTADNTNSENASESNEQPREVYWPGGPCLQDSLGLPDPDIRLRYQHPPSVYGTREREDRQRRRLGSLVLFASFRRNSSEICRPVLFVAYDFGGIRRQAGSAPVPWVYANGDPSSWCFRSDSRRPLLRDPP